MEPLRWKSHSDIEDTASKPDAANSTLLPGGKMRGEMRIAIQARLRTPGVLFSRLLFLSCLLATSPQYVAAETTVAADSSLTAAKSGEQQVAAISDPFELQHEVFTQRLPEITSVELLSLSPAVGGPMKGEEWFPISPSKDASKIKKRVEVQGEPAQKIASLWRKLSPTSEYPSCHQPVFGVRFYYISENRPDLGKQLLFETSICWMCSNFYAPSLYPAGDSVWVFFDTDSPAAKELKALFSELLTD